MLARLFFDLLALGQNSLSKLFIFGGSLATLFHVLHDVAHQLMSTVAVDRRNTIHRTIPFKLLNNFLTTSLALFFRQQIELVQHQPAVTQRQSGREILKLTTDGFYAFRRIRIIKRRHIDNMQQQLSTYQMLEEACAKASTVCRPFNQPRNIRNHKTAVLLNRDHAQIRYQSGERIIRHFRCRCRYRADKGRFSGIWQAQQTDVCQHLQFELQVTRLTRLPRL